MLQLLLPLLLLLLLPLTISVRRAARGHLKIAGAVKEVDYFQPAIRLLCSATPPILSRSLSLPLSQSGSLFSLLAIQSLP